MAVVGPEVEQFQGVIARTHEDSIPWWPEPAVPDASTPSVVYVVFDDVGFSDFGCFGSELATPSVDRLAANGLRYTNFHTTTLCSPTRASLLTGRNHHAVGMRLLSNLDTGFPNGRGRVTKAAATVAEILKQEGFNTFCVGKWHLAPSEHTTPAGPYDQWPLGRGFERYYGFLDAETDSFHPELTYDNHSIDPPRKPEEGYHLTEDLVDKAIDFVRDQTSVTPDKPFFLHLAFGAAHAPHQAPESFLRKQRGRYGAGWDAIRRQRHERQLALGLLPPGTELAPLNPGVLPWNDLTTDERRLYARFQEAYAAMIEHTDHQLGRLLDFLESVGRLDNTIVVLISDNGASQEGGPQGSINTTSFQNGVAENFEESLRRIDDIGGPRTQTNYPWGWAQVSNTPFKRYKQNTHEGGVRDPLVLHWPRGLTKTGAVRDQFHHVIDITPTVLGLLDIQAPEVYAGVPQMPMHGTDMSYSFGDEGAATEQRTQHFEMFGHRGIWHDGWKAVTFHERGTPYADDVWELYHVAVDPSECHDLAAERPDVLRDMVARFWAEADRFGVLPLDDRGFAVRAKVPRPGSPRARSVFTYYPGMGHLPVAAAPPTMNRAHTITAHVDAYEGAEGVLVALGGVSSGYVMYVKDGDLQFEYNFLGTYYHLRSRQPVPAGTASLQFEFIKEGDQRGTGRLLIDGDEVDRAAFPQVLPNFHGWEGLDIGRDGLSPVTTSYQGEFPYTGVIEKVVFRVADGEDAVLHDPVD